MNYIAILPPELRHLLDLYLTYKHYKLAQYICEHTLSDIFVRSPNTDIELLVNKRLSILKEAKIKYTYNESTWKTSYSHCFYNLGIKLAEQIITRKDIEALIKLINSYDLNGGLHNWRYDFINSRLDNEGYRARLDNVDFFDRKI